MNKNIFQKLYHKDLERVYSGFKGIIIDNIVSEIQDLQLYFENIYNEIPPASEILISYHNPAWEPILELATSFGLRNKTGPQNWVDHQDIKSILQLAGFTRIKTNSRFFGITFITTAIKGKKTDKHSKKYSVSIIIPARNESGNIPNIIPDIPKFGKRIEIIFVEGNSTDDTWDKVFNESKKKQPKNLSVKAIKQKGIGKAGATWQGLRKAQGNILMIYDADRTVDAKDLLKFYHALISNPGSLANGNRLLYPMENDAMRQLNKFGNKLFSQLFTWILGQRFKDTLCGTKAFWKSDFKKFKKTKTDPFGDFDLIFSAIRNKLKIIDIPVRYKERVYGKTNINRFYHGLLLFKMVYLAFLEFKLSPRRNIR